jgi:RNA polymerase sigma-70 factor (subfamily 1)
MLHAHEAPVASGSPGLTASGITHALDAARALKPDAIGLLFESVRGRLLDLADRHLPESLRHKVAPSDIVQQTALDAQQHFQNFQGTTAEECFAWLRTTLRNNVIDAVRYHEISIKRGGVREVSLTSDQAYGGSHATMMTRATPDLSAIRREDATSLASVLAELPEDYSLVLRLRYWGGLSFVEIGRQMGRSPDAVRKLWFRGMEQLRAALHEAAMISQGPDSGGGSPAAAAVEAVN